MDVRWTLRGNGITQLEGHFLLHQSLGCIGVPVRGLKATDRSDRTRWVTVGRYGTGLVVPGMSCGGLPALSQVVIAA